MVSNCFQRWILVCFFCPGSDRDRSGLASGFSWCPGLKDAADAGQPGSAVLVLYVDPGAATGLR